MTDALRLQSLSIVPCCPNCCSLSINRHCPSPSHPPLSSASEAETTRTSTSRTRTSSSRRRRKRKRRRRRRRSTRRKNVPYLRSIAYRECMCAVIRTLFELLHQIPRTFTRYFCTTITIVFG